MGKSFRYLLLSFRNNYLAMPAIAAVLVLLCYIGGVPETGDGLFSQYFLMYPSFLVITVLFSGVSLTTQLLSTALSYGANRRDYFRAMLALNLLNTLLFWLSDCLISLLPHLLGWACADTLDPVIVSRSLPFILLFASCAGCALGELVYRHRIITGLLAGLVGAGSVVSAGFFHAMEADTGLWGDLPWLLPVILLALSGLCLLRVRSKTMSAVVR